MTLIIEFEPRTIGLFDNAWGEIGVKIIESTSGVTIGPPADNEYAVDPNGDEWASMDCRVTIISDSDGNICALQKGGNDGFTPEEINQCGELSVKIGAKIREQLKSVQQENQ